MRLFVLMLGLLSVLVRDPAHGFGFAWFQSRARVPEEIFRTPANRYFRTPSGIEVDGDRTRVLIHSGFLRRSRFYWEQETGVDLATIHRSLRDFRVKDLVLSLRALPDGRLFDQRGLQLPDTFFDQLSPSIRTLAIRTCYRDEVIDRYRLRELLSTGNVWSPERMLMVPDPGCS